MIFIYTISFHIIYFYTIINTISFLCLKQFSRNWYEVLALVELMSSWRREEVYLINRQVARGDRRDPIEIEMKKKRRVGKKFEKYINKRKIKNKKIDE